MAWWSGLDGTGDQTTQAPFTTQSLNAMLQQMGITVPPARQPAAANVAAVMVTAQLPPLRSRARRSTSTWPRSAMPRACAAAR
jgi:flagellar basal body P-ring protein FlgI